MSWASHIPALIESPAPMDTSTPSQANDLELIRCCAMRIEGVAAAIESVWEVGVRHGEHREPWTLDFQMLAAGIYLETVPASYALRVAATFRYCADKMSVAGSQVLVDESWWIVIRYLTAVSDSISRLLGTEMQIGQVETVALSPSPPAVIRYDKLAPLLHPEGVFIQQQAAVRVGESCRRPHFVLESEELAWIAALAAGSTVIDLGVANGYSTRSMYRRLASLWRKLGVDDRVHGVAHAARMGWLPASVHVCDPTDSLSHNTNLIPSED